MSGPFRGCIADALGKGEIDRDSASMAEEAYDEAWEAFAGLGPDEADRRAASASIARLEAEKIEARRRRALTVRARRRILEAQAGFKTRLGYQGVQALGGAGGSGRPPKDGWVQGGSPPEKGKPYARGAAAARMMKRLVENRAGLSASGSGSMAGRYEAVRGEFDAMMADLVERFETRTGFDTPHRAELVNIGREAFGQDTGDRAAKGLAEAWKGARDHARGLFNAAGGSIGQIDNYGFPTRHDADLVRKAGKQAWVDFQMPLLDRAGMIDRATGQAFSEARLRAVLGQTWESISSGGASKRTPGESLGDGVLWRSRSHERFLKYRDYDAWAASQSRFGRGDLYEVMMTHLDDMARDIAEMQILGPNPERQWEWLRNFARREAALEEMGGAEGARAKAEGMLEHAELMYATFRGDLNVPVDPAWSGVAGATRAAVTGIRMGSAILGEVGSGPGLGRMAREFAGLDRKGDMGQLARLLADPKERAMARRTGFIIETATDGFVRATQDNLRLVSVGGKDADGANALARRLPAAVMRTSFLTAVVAARKRAWRFEFMGALNDARSRTLADLAKGDDGDRALGRWLEASGFTEQDWAVIRASPVFSPRAGAEFLLPMNVADPELKWRLSEAINMGTRLASPETTIEGRSYIVRDRPGTVMGEMQRSLAMFKGFSTTLTLLYAQEIALQAAARGGGRWALAHGGALAAQGLIFLTIGGAVTMQLREIVKGNDPKPMDDPKFWGAAIAQGGGAGIFGDFLYAAEGRNGYGADVAAYGPMGELVGDAWGLTGGNALEIGGALADGDGLDEALDAANPGRDLARAARSYNPLSSLWWSRAAWNRAVADNVQRGLDPDAEEDFARQRRRLERDMGQGQWWPTGESAPERAPDWGAVWGGLEK